jgi:zinc/manganese transport system ATP-binding protein
MSGIEIRNLTYRINDHLILDNISLDIEEGEFVAILGPNGAGKSTLLQLIMGMIEPTSGSIRVFGAKPQTKNNMIGYAPQTRGFDEDLPIIAKDYVMLGLEGEKFGIAINPKDGKSNTERVMEVLSEIDATNLATKKIGRLSGGEQQRISIAQALVSEPKMLLLDEPLANLDLSFQKDVVARLSENHIKHKHTILLVAHDINPLLSSINRVIYLANSHATIGKPSDVITEETLSALYGTRVKVFTIDNEVFVAASDGIVH